MNENSRDIHVTELIADYVLDLLPKADKERITMHISACVDCRAALQQERKIAQLVRSTLSVATQPDNRRLRQLHPDLPGPRLRLLGTYAWQKPLAAALLLLLVLAGSLGLQRTDRPSLMPSGTATYAKATATNTTTITATVTSSLDLTSALAQATPYIAKPISNPESRLSGPLPSITPVPSPPILN